MKEGDKVLMSGKKKKTFGQGLTPLHQGPFKMESLTEKGVATIKITKTVVPGRKST